MIETDAPTLPFGDQRASAAHAPARAFVAAAEQRFPVKRTVLFSSRARGDERPDSETGVALILAEATLALADL